MRENLFPEEDCFSKSNCILLQISSVDAVVNVTLCTVLIHLNVECPDIIIILILDNIFSPKRPNILIF